MKTLQLALAIGLALISQGCHRSAAPPKQPPASPVAWPVAAHSLKPRQSAWTMIDVTEAPQQADAHLLDLADGTRILIDVGHRGRKLVPYLSAHGIPRVDLVLITHPHHDHYGGLRPAIEAGLQIGEVRMNFPDRRDCDREKPWGCRWEEIQSLREFLLARGIPLKPARPGDVLHRSALDQLEVLYAFDRESRPEGPGDLDINDHSVIALYTHRGAHRPTRALFTGDLNRPIGNHLARSGRRLEAELLKVPHHGTESCAPDGFFDRVRPRAAFVPAPAELWSSERSRRIREYFARKKIPASVSGRDGDVTTVFTDDGFETLPKPPIPGYP